tara:strand:+ start:35 stop:2377 length:2343 start_codon:yes stop_codon:yes gene_type:complete
MPKQFKTYSRFDGGLNTKTNSRSIQDNELAQADNVIVDEFGVVKSCGKFIENTSSGKDYQAPSVGSLNGDSAGYGLFQSRFDYNQANSNTSVISTFYADPDTGSNVVVDRSDGHGNTFADAIDLGAVTGTNQGKVIYHIADGIIRACDTNINNTSTTIRKYGHFLTEKRWKDSSGVDKTPGGYGGANGFSDLDSKLSKPTRGLCSKGMRASVSSGSDTSLTSGTADSFPASTDTELDSGVYLAVNRSDQSVDTISSRTNTTVLVTGAGSATFTGGELYGVYPPGGTGFNLDFSTSGGLGGTWVAGTYEFAITFLYDGDQESLPYILSGELTVSDNDVVDCTVMATENHSSARYAANVKGGRIYFRRQDTDGAFIFFGEINFVEGTKPTIDGSFTHWDLEFASAAFAHSTFRSSSINVETYDTLNGYSQDSPFISIGEAGEKYQTSVVSNRRAFIANVRYTDEEGTIQNNGDTIRYSEINKFDTFLPFNFLDIGVNDGEEFIKLEAFADRLLAYKEKTLYIINIGGGSDTQWFLESTHNNMGVDFHSAVVKTELGVCWVNKNGLYIYDGSRITNLQTKIIESEWTSFIGSDTMLAYEPTHKHLVVIKSASNSGSDNGDAYIYSFIANSFTKITTLISDSIKTNPITDLHNNLSIGIDNNNIHSYDGEPSNHQTFDIKLKDDDFGLPNIVKKVYGVTVEYSTTEANSNGVKFEYINDSGAKVASANLGSLSDTNDAVTVDKFNIGSPVLASSFQVQLDLDGNCDHKIHSVGVEYRPLYKRIT